MNIFFLDFETTGFNPYYNDPIEVAIKKFTYNEIYNEFIIPKEINFNYKYVPAKITDLTGITDNMIIENGKNKYAVIYNVMKFIERYSSDDDKPIYIVSHNGTTFDFLILKRLIKTYNDKHTGNQLSNDTINRLQYIDSVLLARMYLKEESVKQCLLCKKYNIKNFAEHRAIGDIQALEQIYVRLCEQFSHTKGYNYNYYIDHPEEVIKECMFL
jgi:DNA polymerase III alpha subunit (gram-positive type)|tara:strand:- start:121 stop:762 length:642 start_codon:yes stop_codon:yes gene_type:complete